MILKAILSFSLMLSAFILCKILDKYIQKKEKQLYGENK